MKNKKHGFRHKAAKRSGIPGQSRHYEKMKPEIEPALKNVFAKIGKPASASFVPDAFQLAALEAIKKTNCLVMAPTGTGKTWIAEQAILSVFKSGGRCWYASPLKALTNAKWIEFGNHFDPANVGILTGDTKENADAPIIVGTTEILRNQLYDVMHSGENLNCDLVILDEAHYLGDRDRGVVWEEILIYLPVRINVLLLSATIGNGEEIAAWLSSLRGKKCVVVKEEKRPVPLYPLVLHPSGKLMPYLEKKNLFPALAKFLENRRGRGRGGPPHFGQIINALEEFQLLPAIFFLKSRSECDAALKSCYKGANLTDDEGFYRDVKELLNRFPYLKSHKQMDCLENSRVAAHHGGQLPTWKFFVETMMKLGHLRAIFATSTVAAGVNYPARTIVLFNSDLFNGSSFSPLSSTEFHQMTGRAGRRGRDNIGFMLAIPGRFMDIPHLKKLFFKKPDDILSQIRSDFSMILNLLLSQTPEDIRGILEKSLASYQRIHGSKKRHVTEGANLWDDCRRHLDFLREEGFVEGNGRLTESGVWASKLRLDHPLLIAECLKKEAFPRKDEKLLASMVAPFVYDGDQDIKLANPQLARRLMEAYRRVNSAINTLAGRMDEAGFPTSPLYFWTSSVMYDWARGKDWDEIVKNAGIADGDLAMLVLRTADNLRQIASLRETHREIAHLALRARESILREPVLFE
ncbi:MAG TPA: DEAD/DEAH box helicase [Syntrophales bacterium]|nr:DEAD/DEAH box helicase [Syntrophales bacterium]